MPIDINLLRGEEKGGDIERVRESQRRRFASVEVIDEIVALDTQWRELIFKRDNMRKEKGLTSKKIGAAKKKGEDTTKIQEAVRTLTQEIKDLETKIDEVEKERDSKLNTIGNIVDDSVPISKTEDDNRIERTWGTPSRTGKELHHHELLYMIDGYDSEMGVTVAGHRGYFLKGVGVQLNQALINYALDILRARNYTALQPPFFMRKEVMAETAQLSQFDEELYKVSGGTEDTYLIATSEQPISAFHRKQWMDPASLPKKYAGYSTCFRKEAGSHGKDTWGIFRIHQFEKVEQFVVTDPESSKEMHEAMASVAEEFYQRLKIPYRVINIASGHLNNAAAKKLDIEAWFPTLGVFRELVSCSNCTDYQSRAMETRYGHKKQGSNEKTYVHMLNGTLTATERSLCCLLENYQCDEGVRVPDVLQKYMGGVKLLPFVKECPVNVGKLKTEKGMAKAAKKKAETKKGKK
jgi:seryl-tRNA synthetase